MTYLEFTGYVAGVVFLFTLSGVMCFFGTVFFAAGAETYAVEAEGPMQKSFAALAILGGMLLVFFGFTLFLYLLYLLFHYATA